MSRRVRLLLVTAACLALFVGGLVAVVTRDDPRSGAAPLATDLDAGDTPSVPNHDDSQAIPEASRPEATTSKSPARAKPTGPANAVRTGATTTTRPGAGTTTTTATTLKGTTGTTTTTTGPSGPKCPNAKTCDIYVVIGPAQGGPSGGTKGWRPDSDGIVRIRFKINPAPPVGSGLTEDTMEAAFLRGTKIIEAYHPRIQFVYQGRTTGSANNLDGVNVFAFGDRTWHRYDSQGYIVESDIGPSAGFTGGDWRYTPCEQHDNACPRNDGTGDIMPLIVHEEMHTLGLADLFEQESAELTMRSGSSVGGNRQTLGLGDVLGLRALYPTNAPMPPIYSP